MERYAIIVMYPHKLYKNQDVEMITMRLCLHGEEEGYDEILYN